MLVKKVIKRCFKAIHGLALLDRINFAVDFLRNYQPNKKFKEENPNFSLPPAYFLYETYKLNFQMYNDSGREAAMEILEWVRSYLPPDPAILEWGCGVARITRHISPLISPAGKVFGCDINPKMICWDAAHIFNATFDIIDYVPPCKYRSSFFDFVYGISVFTHIESSLQEDWLREIARILKPGGIFLFTTHGSKFFSRLDRAERKVLQRQGSFTLPYSQKGHRMMSTYSTFEHFKCLTEKYFRLLEYHSGEENAQKVGGQDLWIVQKA